MHCIDLSKFNIRTDLFEEQNFDSVKKTERKLNSNCTLKISKYKKNKYVSIFFNDITDKDNFLFVEDILVKQLKNFLNIYHINRKNTVLVVGLGNSKSTPDSLGSLSIDNILVTKYLFNIGEVSDDYSNVATFKTEVTGTTGIETFNLVKAVIAASNAKLLIVIDSLAASNIENLNKVIQISDAGISPGSGVGNNRKELSYKSLGIPVIAVGVPTVVSASTIVRDSLFHMDEYIDNISNISSFDFVEKYQSNKDDLKILFEDFLNYYDTNLIVSPKEIDFLIEKESLLIANSINKSLHKDFNPTK